MHLSRSFWGQGLYEFRREGWRAGLVLACSGELSGGTHGGGPPWGCGYG